MKKNKEVDSIMLEKKTMDEKFKNIKEFKTGRRDHVSSGSGKGKVNIVSKKVTEEDLTLTEKEKVAREKRDKELDELNALREKLDVEEAEARNSEMILENNKALFPAWMLDRMQSKLSMSQILFGWNQKPISTSKTKWSVSSISLSLQEL
ncbi:unnamed protein product [Lactuca virosa]|uniref:RAB6-interacting golgin n=1 Tax=Lactuca virosa TaxID=75947 RepID=A0AAU9PRQ4_9ASTR|nr:unnamed protein product [Lactuca virosa]